MRDVTNLVQISRSALALSPRDSRAPTVETWLYKWGGETGTLASVRPHKLVRVWPDLIWLSERDKGASGTPTTTCTLRAMTMVIHGLPQPKQWVLIAAA